VKFSHFFIDRPIFASVVSLVIVIVGTLAYFNLPISQYPEVVPPTITVTATYPGASPEVLAKTVAQPIEQQINGVERMLYMNTICTVDGRMTITVTFELGTDIDEAQVLVQNRVAVAEPRLPEEVRRQGVVVRKSSPDLMLVVHVLSPDGTFDQLYISNYVNIQVVDALKRVRGVGDITVFGGREYSMRIWLDPLKMGELGLTSEDLLAALREQNVQVAAGAIAQPPVQGNEAFQFTVSTEGRLEDIEQFDNIVVKSSNGRVVRLRDVARVELGALSYATNSYLSGQPAVGIGVFQLPGSNALATAEAVRAEMEKLSENFPPGLTYRIAFDPTIFIEESVKAVYHTIFEAAILVVIVILLFLQTWRAALIPLIAIPVSLIGTFAAMAACGFSLNNLSLFGLVLAIGIVVDDAIVVVENVERHIRAGLNPRDASRKAMDEVGSAVIAVALVLAAVFVPTAFLSGITGQFYRQFALTIAFSTGLSALVSLTLSPALTAILLQPHHAPRDRFTRLLDFSLGWLFRAFNAVFARSEHGYSSVVARLVRHTAIGLFIYAGLLGLTWLGFSSVPTGFIPAQDQGYLIIDGQLPEAASLQRSDEVAKQVVAMARETEGIADAVAIVGFSAATRANASNSFAIFTPLKPFDERKGHKNLSATAISQALSAKVAGIQGARITVIPPPPVRGLGTAGGFKLFVQDRRDAGLAELEKALGILSEEAMKQPSIAGVFSTFRTGTPQFYADVDRTKAKMLDVPLANVFNALQTYLGSSYVNDLNLYGRTFQVTAQADSEFRDAPEDVRTFKVRSNTGAMVPLGSLVQLKRVAGPNRVERFNLYTAAPLQGATKPGFSSGQSLDDMEIAAKALPEGMELAWTEIAFQERLAGNTALFIFPLCVLFVFLTLAAQYESWSLPLAIILIVPMCLLSAIAGVWFRGMDNNILTQIGFVVLVGLACKNAILIVEFSKQIQENQGWDRFAATVEACRLRLRPILMTSFAFILGVLPLVLATGPGAEARQALGTAVFFGMLGVTFFGIFLTPIFYVVIMGFAERRKARKQRQAALAEPSHA